MPGYNQYHCPDCGGFASVVHERSNPPNGEEPVEKAHCSCHRCGIDWIEKDKGTASR